MYSVKIHPEFRLVHFRFCGPLSVSLFRRAFLDFVESPQFDPTYLFLFDDRAATEIYTVRLRESRRCTMSASGWAGAAWVAASRTTSTVPVR